MTSIKLLRVILFKPLSSCFILSILTFTFRMVSIVSLTKATRLLTESVMTAAHNAAHLPAAIGSAFICRQRTPKLTRVDGDST